MNSQQDDAKDWNVDFIPQKLRETNCSQLFERFFDSNTLLHLAARSGNDQIVEAILSIQQCQELLMAKNSCGDLPLHIAANAGNLLIVQHLVSSSPQRHELLMAQNSNGDLPLHLAAKAGHLSIVKHLVSLSPQCHELLMAQNSNDDLPLHLAAKAGHLSIVQHLVSSSPQRHELLMAQNSNGDLPLHLAAKARHLSIVQHLVSSSPQRHELLMAQNSNGDLPLHVAVNAGKLYIVKYLVKLSNQCQEILTTNPSIDKIPLLERRPEKKTGPKGDKDAAMRKERYKPSRLEKKVPHESKDKVKSMDGELYEAVKSQDIDFIQKKGRDLEHSALSDKTPELNTILHLAAASSDDDHQFVQAILKIRLCQNFVTEKNSKGDLPFHVAASAGNMQIVELLVQWSDEHSNCAPLWDKNMQENTPGIRRACRGGEH